MKKKKQIVEQYTWYIIFFVREKQEESVRRNKDGGKQDLSENTSVYNFDFLLM